MHLNKNHLTPSEPAWRKLRVPILGRLVVGARWYFDRGYEARAAESSEAERELAQMQFEIHFSFGSVGPGGLPTSTRSYHRAPGEPWARGKAWRGTFREAMEIIRREYDPKNGTTATIVAVLSNS